MRSYKAALKAVKDAFDRDILTYICEAPEAEFAKTFGMETVMVQQPAPSDFYLHRDNGSKILAVAHLDTVGLAHQRACRYVNTEAGEVVYSRALDDRLGAYIILDLLPALGINHDVLLTVGEEDAMSTADFFDPPKAYNSMIEFDRGGTDVVLYDYEDEETVNLVRHAGAVVGQGSFSDISYLEHLEIKGFNWGVGYRDYHGPRAHAFLEDTYSMVAKYLAFHEATKDMVLPHFGSTRLYSRLDDAWTGTDWTGYGSSTDNLWDVREDYAEYPTQDELNEIWEAEEFTQVNPERGTAS